MPERKKVCDNCRFLAVDNRCHRRAPAADDHGTPIFPIIQWSDHQWCGDWESDAAKELNRILGTTSGDSLSGIPPVDDSPF